MSPLLRLGVVAAVFCVAVLVTLRLARLWPALRPLMGPFALAVATSTGVLLFSSQIAESQWTSLVVFLPLLVLGVRSVVLVFGAAFQRSQGAPPPGLLASVVSVLLYGIGAAVVVRFWFGIDLTPVLATSAVLGAVVGLALQDTLGNLFAGIALHTEAPFHVGDWLTIGNHQGCVEEVSWRATRLRTWDGDSLVVPNNEVARHSILNHSRPQEPHSRVLLIGVNYQTPPNKVLSVLRGLLEQVEGMPRTPPAGLRVVAYGDFAISYEIRYHVSGHHDCRRVEGEIHRLIWYHFRRHGIEIPFPIRNVYLHQAEAGADSNQASTTRLERALRAIDLFRPLSEAELREAAARFRLLHYAAGESIIVEGAPGDSFFVIDRGEVQVTKRVAGERRNLARLMEGQFFGEMALLTGEERSATVVAATDVDLFTIDKPAFHDILVANPAIAVDISTILSERREAQVLVEDAAPRNEGRPETRQRILERICAYFGI
jgi:small-conductance mechanosensitive channel